MELFPNRGKGLAVIYTIQNRLGEIDWSRVVAGDEVRLPYRREPYREKILVSTPVKLVGLKGPYGERPVISGEGAVTDRQFAYSYRPIEDSGLITLYRRTDQKYEARPTGVWIEGLEITGASGDNADPTYAAFDGTRRAWAKSSCGIYGVTADDVTIRDCVIRGNGDGVLCLGRNNRNWTLDGNVFSGNGAIGSDKQHHSYVECFSAVYRNNLYLALRPGSLGGALKDRSTGPLVEGNTFLAGARMVDLSAPQESMAAALMEPGYLSATVADNTFVVRNGGGAMAVYYEGRAADQTRPYHLTFHGNTLSVIRDQKDLWRFVTIKSEAAESPVYDVDANTWSCAPASAGQKAPELSLLGNNMAGTVNVGRNWARPGLLQVASGFAAKATFVGWENLVTAPA